MSSPPRVSVVIAFLNGERFLNETIESVFRQTFTDWELLLVDDGSTDGSTAIAQRWVRAQAGRVRYVAHPGHDNRGLPASRNLGIRTAQGSLIATLDADDVWRPNKLAEQVAILDAHPTAGMVFGASEYWSSWSGADGDVGCDFTPDLGVEADRLYEPPSLLLRLYPLSRATAPCPSDLLIRRSAIEHVGWFEEDFHSFYEDQAFLTKMYLHLPIYVSSSSWLRYRVHKDSDCHRAENDPRSGSAVGYHRTRRYFLGKFERYLRSEGVTDSLTWAALRRAQFPYRYPRLHTVHGRIAGVIAECAARTRRAARHTLPRAVRQWLRARIRASA
jgi:glycosyltransferase involved in cell wall biosynthesis